MFPLCHSLPPSVIVPPCVILPTAGQKPLGVDWGGSSDFSNLISFCQRLQKFKQLFAAAVTACLFAVLRLPLFRNAD